MRLPTQRSVETYSTKTLKKLISINEQRIIGCNKKIEAYMSELQKKEMKKLNQKYRNLLPVLEKYSENQILDALEFLGDK